MRGTGIIIAGMGHAIPPNIVTNRDLEARSRTSDQFIVSRTGVRERRFADPSQATSDLMEPAALEAIRNAGLGRGALSLLSGGATRHSGWTVKTAVPL